MVWGKGGLFNAWMGGAIGTMDFAGGTVVHVSSGVSALVCAIMLGKRRGYGRHAMPPHSVVLSVIGAALLWVGWFGFNAGSALRASPLASTAFVNTHLAASAGALMWAAVEWFRGGKPTVLGAISGAVAGLVAITPASGYTLPMYAMIIGAAAGLVCFFGATSLKHIFGYDDTLDAFGVHGVGGTLGAILTGVFAVCAVNCPPGLDIGGKLGLVEGNWHPAIHQLIAVGLTWVLAAGVSWAILSLLNVTIGLRVPAADEYDGLDLSQHGESGYNFEDAIAAELESDSSH
jgi:Amt family ammonium transporter